MNQPTYFVTSNNYLAFSASIGSTTKIIGSGYRLAYKFWASWTSPITAVDGLISFSGSMTGIKMSYSIYTDAGDVPGTLLGAATATFAVPTVNLTSTGLQSLGADTGTLTLNTPYWLVVDYDPGGTVPTATNSFGIAYTSLQLAGEKIRQYNGTDWTTVAVSLFGANFILQDTDGNKYGCMYTANATISGVTAIYGGNRQGFMQTVGVPCNISSVRFKIRKSGTPANLECSPLRQSNTREFRITIP